MLERNTHRMASSCQMRKSNIQAVLSLGRRVRENGVEPF